MKSSIDVIKLLRSITGLIFKLVRTFVLQMALVNFLAVNFAQFISIDMNSGTYKFCVLVIILVTYQMLVKINSWLEK